MSPFVSDPDFDLYVGDVREVLAGLPDGSVDCCVTSPPYWGLRDYGTDGQIGLEATPELFVAEMVAVFGEVRRVLAPHGTLWLNLGDSYARTGGDGAHGPNAQVGNTKSGQARRMMKLPEAALGVQGLATDEPAFAESWRVASGNIKEKDLCGIPWRVAFALQADGWYLRADVIWSKPNPMPESVTDRPTKAHEYVFLLSKQPRYFFDQEAIREPAEWARWGDQTVKKPQPGTASWIKPRTKEDLHAEMRMDEPERDLFLHQGEGPHGELRNGKNERTGDRRKDGFNARWDATEVDGTAPTSRNVRSVWEIATQPYPDAHFATFPEALPERCIKAGTPESVCLTCGEPRVRVTSIDYENPGNRQSNGARKPEDHRASGVRTMAGGKRLEKRVTTEGFTDCGHGNYRTGVVLDPFMGSGTTALVARRLGRKSIGVELNPEYAQLAARRLQQLSLLAEDVA